MKLNIWDIRERYDGYIVEQVRRQLPGRDETDVLAVVDAVYEHLERVGEIRAEHGKASEKAFIRTAAWLQSVSFIRRWSSAKHFHPGEVTMPRPDLVRSPASAPPRKGEGGRTPERASFCGTLASQKGDAPSEGGKGDYWARQASQAWEKMTAMGKESGQREAGSQAHAAGTYGPDPAGAYESAQLGTDKDDLASLAVRHGVRLKNPHLLEAQIDGLPTKEIASKFGLSEKQVLNQIDYDKRRLEARLVEKGKLRKIQKKSRKLHQ